MNTMRNNNNEQMIQQQQQQMGGDPSVSGRPPDLMNNNNNSNQQILQPPPNMTLSMAPFPGLGSMGGDQQLGVRGSTPPPAPPPRCQIMNPFLGTPPLISHMDRMQQQQPVGGASSLGQMETTFSPDIRHRGYPSVLNLPSPFQVHPNLHSQIQAFQSDMGQQQQQHMIQQQQTPGFLQGFIPTEIVSNVSDSHNSSHLLQPQVRQRARRRSRANRPSSIVQHVHEAPPTLAGGNGGERDATSGVALGQSRELPPTAQITVDSAFEDNGIVTATATVAPATGATTRLEDAKLKGLEENYSSIGENFECNICFQKANEAVVTCCGHLFCWPCLYRWLHIHSYHKECPVCKGAIDESTITPIYGRECSPLLSARGMSGSSANERIPPRPPARRVESARQLREREDRGREREQRERALEREREREREQQSESQGLAEILVGQQPGVGVISTSTASTPTTLIEEGGMMRDSTNSVTQSQVGGGGGSTQENQQEEIDSRESAGHEDTNSSTGSVPHHVGPPGVMNMSASSFQEPTSIDGGRTTLPLQGQGVGQGGATQVEVGTNNSPSTHTSNAPAFLQRRVSDRREQLRAALAASARSGGVNSIPSTLAERVDERRQMIAAAALLSQEWEDIVNISRLVGPVNPVQAAAWIAAVQGRQGNSIEGTSLQSLGNFPSHPHHHQQQQHASGGGGGMMLHSQPIHRSHASSRHMITSPTMVAQDGSSGGEDSTLSHLVTADPLQAGTWLANMRSRLTSMEKIVENLESPLQVLQQPIPTSMHLNLPLVQSSILQGGQLLQTSSGTPVGLHELSLLDNSVSNSTTTSLEGPSGRTMEERVVATITSEAPSLSTLPTGSSSSNTLTSSQVHSNSRTQVVPRLHYREAPIPKPPSSSRRRSSRTSEEGTSMTTNNNQGQSVAIGGQQDGTTEGSGYPRPQEPTASSRSKRRRLDN